jgi:4-hydroxy-tetrahydrodipicolinate synthase
MSKRRFSGVIAPVATPFGPDGAPDPDRFAAHATWLLEHGCAALAPFGTTSEANSLGLDERMELLEELIDAGIDPSKLMPGTGMCSTTDAAILTQHAVDNGCGGVLMLPPFYFKAPSEDGVFDYYADVIDEVADSDLKVYLYHIPQMSGVPITVDLIGRLLKEFPETVVGTKDSAGDLANMQKVMATYPELEFFPGSEALLLPALEAGAAGVISASANINAAAMLDLISTYSSPGAETKQASLSAIRQTLQAYPIIPVLKALLAHYRNDPEWANVRPPLTALPSERAQEAARKLATAHGFELTFSDADS